MNSKNKNNNDEEPRSQSAQDNLSPAVNFPTPPRPWITDMSEESSQCSDDDQKEDGAYGFDKPRIRHKFRIKQKVVCNVPVGFFWDIENCQVPRGCSAIDVVSAIRAKFLIGRREVDFVVVCDVRKEMPTKLQELNDSQINLIHVCGTQKNAADEKLRQCMRRFGELHTSPAAIVLISGDINFASDLSDFRHRKNMEVILVHKKNTSTALIACASSHYDYNDITCDLPGRVKNVSQSEPEEDSACELVVNNLPLYQPLDRVAKRLKRLADNCGGKVIKITLPTAILRFSTPELTSRALKRMNGEDVFGRRISTHNIRSLYSQPSYTVNTTQYSSDEGYGTAAAIVPPHNALSMQAPAAAPQPPIFVGDSRPEGPPVTHNWALSLQDLPMPTPPVVNPDMFATYQPRQIRGTHGSNNLDESVGSFNNTNDLLNGLRDNTPSRAISPWNSSASFSEHSSDYEVTEPSAELTVTNLPSRNHSTLLEMLTQLFSQHVPVVNITIWGTGESAIASVQLKSLSDARILISRLHKRRLENQWAGRRLELSLGKPSPAQNYDVLRARLRAILLDQPNYSLPLLRLRDAYASRHCFALTTSDIARVRDTVVVHENLGRMVQLIDASPRNNIELEDTAWKCNLHGIMNVGQEDGIRILTPVYTDLALLAKQTQHLLETHNGMLPLLSYVECYQASFPPLVVDAARGVALELLLRSIPAFVIRDTPLRHITWNTERTETPSPVSQISEGGRSSRDRDRPRTAPCLEPMLSLFEREIVDLLRTAQRCTIPFSKLIPSYHHHFGRQCRVADYGFTKLPDLLAALSNTILVLGSGSSRLITLSATAQARRWTTELLKLIKGQIRPIFIYEIPAMYQSMFERPFIPADFGVCSIGELMDKLPPQTIVVCRDGSITLPKRIPTNEERSRTLQFAAQAVELLCYTPNLRMEFARFVPSYHDHFGRQLRVAHYGCVKLLDLFELISDAVVVKVNGGDRVVHLALKHARGVIAQRVAAISPVSLTQFPAVYASKYGALPLPDMLEVNSIDALVSAVGGSVLNMVVRVLGETPNWVSAALTACAVLSSDRSVAKGSTKEFFINTFKEQCGVEPNIQHMDTSGVIRLVDDRILLTNVWRLVWRVAVLLSVHKTPLTCTEITHEYSKLYGPVLPNSDIGFTSVKEFVRNFREVFVEDDHQRFTVCEEVAVPDHREAYRTYEDFSIHDTPPGQKVTQNDWFTYQGSRVFESPKPNIWCSPPASALPTPHALLGSDNKRRTRLAAQFNDA